MFLYFSAQINGKQYFYDIKGKIKQRARPEGCGKRNACGIRHPACTDEIQGQCGEKKSDELKGRFGMVPHKPCTDTDSSQIADQITAIGGGESADAAKIPCKNGKPCGAQQKIQADRKESLSGF